MTSNLGSRSILEQVHSLGFHSSTTKPESRALSAARKHFSPEFMNRIDEVIIYKMLTRSSLHDILELELAKLQGLLSHRLVSRYTLQVSEGAKASMVTMAINPKYGARELKRVLTRRILQPFVEMLNEDDTPKQGIVKLDEDLNLTVKARKAKVRPAAAGLKLG